jgi:SAM-dependent methyltransferase
MKIGIIGTGMINIGIMTKIVKNKNMEITMFDRNNNVGGFWNTNHFEDLSIQTNTKEYIIDNYIWKHNKNNANKFEVINYFRDIINSHKNINMKLNFNIVRVVYDKVIRKYTIFYTQNNNIEKQYQETFDFIIHSSESSKINIPIKMKIPYFHYSQLSSEVLSKISNNYENIIVLGGGKGSYEVVYSFAKRKKHVTWVCRDLYHVYDLETKSRILHPKSTKHVQKNTYYQKKVNSCIKYSKLIISKNIKLTENNIFVNNEKIPCDCMVYCTGYKKEILNVYDKNNKLIEEDKLNSFFSKFNKTTLNSKRDFGQDNAFHYANLYDIYLKIFYKNNFIERDIIYYLEEENEWDNILKKTYRKIFKYNISLQLLVTIVLICFIYKFILPYILVINNKIINPLSKKKHLLFIFSIIILFIYLNITKVYILIRKSIILNWFESDAKKNDNVPLNNLSGWNRDSKSYDEMILHAVSKMNPPIKANKSIFDFGCGVGAALKTINEHYNNSLIIGGSDLSINAINKIKEIFPNKKNNFFKLGMTDRHPLPNNSQDHVISIGALGMYLYKNEMLVAIKEAVRITKPGGSLCFTNFIHPQGKFRGSILDKVKKSFWYIELPKLNLENIKIHNMIYQEDRYLIVCNKKL